MIRADAARNHGSLVRAARQVYAELGPDATLDKVAERAGVGIATLYRRFPNKNELIRAALTQGIAEEVAPAIDCAVEDGDPRRGLATLMEATMSLVAHERNLLSAAEDAGALTAEVTAPVIDPLMVLTERGQAAGVIRADVATEDIQRVMGMLAAVLPSMDVGSQGWRRYVALVLDALSPVSSRPLPTLAPLVVAHRARRSAEEPRS